MKTFFPAAEKIVILRLGMTWFPLGLENRENLEKWEGIFQSGKSQGILSRLEKSGNFTQNTGKIRKKLCWKIEKKKKNWKIQGNLSASNSENPTNIVPYFK